jgi:hypothetical protein
VPGRTYRSAIRQQQQFHQRIVPDKRRPRTVTIEELEEAFIEATDKDRSW